MASGVDIIARGLAAKAVGELDSKANLVNGKVPAEELPSYVDDVTEYEDREHFPEEGEEGKIYVALDTGFTYRWSGSEYIQIGGQDLSNFVDLDSAQTITGRKELSGGIKGPLSIYDTNGTERVTFTGADMSGGRMYPKLSNTFDLGTPTLKYKDGYFAGTVYTPNIAMNNGSVDWKFVANGDYSFTIYRGANALLSYVTTQGLGFDAAIYPLNPNLGRDLGKSDAKWRDLYLSGNIKDGTNEVAVSKIANKDLIGDEYDNTATYAVGDVVIYNNKLYQCNTAITVAEDWDPTHWDVTNIVNLIIGAINARY